uniref:Uncharacterized protein n=1 Tax=Arundo donax TaxID=35708 RepID=A0A0A9H574_ARUDO
MSLRIRMSSLRTKLIATPCNSTETAFVIKSAHHYVYQALIMLSYQSRLVAIHNNSE